MSGSRKLVCITIISSTVKSCSVVVLMDCIRRERGVKRSNSLEDYVCDLKRALYA